MHMRVTGDNVPRAVLERVGALTDRAQLDLGSIRHRDKEHELVFRLRRFPLRKRRRLLGNLYETESPISCEVRLRNVLSCTVGNRLDPGRREAELMFGLHLTHGELYACSPDEDHGTPLFELKARVAGIDLEITDLESHDGPRAEEGND